MRLSVVPVCAALDERSTRLFNASAYDFDSQIELYHRHNAFVRQIVPKDRLLMNDLKEGYEPLCRFLNVPVPTDERGNKLEFPHANDSASMQRGFKFAKATGCVIWCVALGGVYFGVMRIAHFVS